MPDVAPVLAFAAPLLHARRIADLTAHYAPFAEPPPRRVAKAIRVNGTRYASTLDAATALGVSMVKIREVAAGTRVIAGLTAVYCE